MNISNVSNTNASSSSYGIRLERKSEQESTVQDGGVWHGTSVEDKGHLFIDSGVDVYHTYTGKTVDTKYDYAEQFDEVSHTYGENVLGLLNGNGKSTDNTNVISDMEEKYNELKQQIIQDYSGDEQADRLSDLEKNYQFFMKENVYEPTQMNINIQRTLNKVQSAFADMYNTSVDKNGKAYADEAFMADLTGLSSSMKATKSKLDIMQQMFDKFKEYIEESHDKNKGGTTIANDMLKDIGAGLYAIKKSETTATEKILASGNSDIQELWNLLDKKDSIYQSIGKKATTDEEKYQSYLDGKKSADGMDRRIQGLIDKLSA